MDLWQALEIIKDPRWRGDSKPHLEAAARIDSFFQTIREQSPVMVLSDGTVLSGTAEELKTILEEKDMNLKDAAKIIRQGNAKRRKLCSSIKQKEKTKHTE